MGYTWEKRTTMGEPMELPAPDSSTGARFIQAAPEIPTPRPGGQAVAYAAALLVVAVCVSLSGLVIALAAHVMRHLYRS